MHGLDRIRNNCLHENMNLIDIIIIYTLYITQSIYISLGIVYYNSILNINTYNIFYM